jgi:hypothetical protein
MNPSTQDEIKGTFHEVKGKIKETAKLREKSGRSKKYSRSKFAESLPGACSCVWDLMHLGSLTSVWHSEVLIGGDTHQPHEPTTSAHEPASLLPPPINGASCAPKIYA